MSNIQAWKEQYGAVYSVSVKGKDYVFRALTISEYENIYILNNCSIVDKEDLVVATALLEPEVLDDSIPAGVVSMLSDEIENISGAGEPRIAKEILVSKRNNATNIYSLMKAFILSQIPAYTPEQLNGFNYNQLAEKVALAEQIIKIKQAVLPLASGRNGTEDELSITFELIDPEERAAEEAARLEQERKKAERMGRKPHTDKDAAPPIKPTIKPDDPIARKLRAAMQG